MIDKKKSIVGIDLFKLLFTVFIPLLHIKYMEGGITIFLSQYLARMGVPFFFCCTGYFLEGSIKTTTIGCACRKYCIRSLWLLCLWLPVIVPMYINNIYGRFQLSDSEILDIFKNLLFLSPGYLWYLSASVFGILIYCGLKQFFLDKPGVLLFVGGALYLIGCLGNSWDFLKLIPEWYYDFFLSTRNGLFFAAPLMMVGAFIYNHPDIKARYLMPIVILAYFVEVFLVRNIVDAKTDTSMYFTIPFLLYYIMTTALGIRVSEKTEHFLKETRQWGVLFYCMQYPCFTVIEYFTRNELSTTATILVNYLGLLICSVIAYLFIHKSGVKWLHRFI